jgi:hypothetical protein
MARLFIRHEPVACTVTHGLSQGKFTVRRQVLQDAGIDVTSYSTDFVYVCIVYKGVVWAGRRFWLHSGGSLVQITAAPMEDQPCVQQMLLADMILN